MKRLFENNKYTEEGMAIHNELYLVINRILSTYEKNYDKRDLQIIAILAANDVMTEKIVDWNIPPSSLSK